MHDSSRVNHFQRLTQLDHPETDLKEIIEISQMKILFIHVVLISTV